MNTDVTYKIAFASLKGLNMVLGQQLLSAVGSEENFFNASESQLGALIGSKNKLLTKAVRDKALDEASTEAEFITANNISFKYFTDPAFPARLKECDDAPLGIFTIGNCDLNKKHFVSIVGTRHATPYGLSFINNLVSDLSEKIDDLVIVSGLAYGADIAAHRAALDNDIPTIAVFAHGLSTVYPAAHRNDAAKIVQRDGMVVTEYFHSAPIHRGNFLSRNRIVAGLSDCLVVVESAVKGGALVTARIAVQYNRDVFALPGRISDPYSAGCNALIAGNDAALIRNADDLISAMRWTPHPTEACQKEMFPELTDQEQAVIDYLTANSESRINKLSVDLNITISRLMSVLVDLEFKGLIINYPGGLYRLA